MALPTLALPAMVLPSLDDPVIGLGLVAFALLLLVLPLSFWTLSGARAGSPSAAAATPLTGSAVRLLVAAANLCLTAQLVLRWWDAGHFPISNLYESLCFLAWGCTLTQLLVERAWPSPLVPAAATPMALGCVAFASFALPERLQEASPLVPALRSSWLVMHVSVIMLSYAALLVGSLLSVAVLFTDRGLNLQLRSSSIGSGAFRQAQAETQQRASAPVAVVAPAPVAAAVSAAAPLPVAAPVAVATPVAMAAPLTPASAPASSATAVRAPAGLAAPAPGLQLRSERISLAEQLDSLSYRTITVGFLLLSVGLVSGAVWANEAWGSWWSWDPKETWALICWLVYAAYLHTRLIRGWQGRKPALVASAGLVVIVVCYIGVNLLGIGLHSYGWFFDS